MASVNKVILLGFLGQDPDLHYTPSGTAIANFNLATEEKWTKDGEKQTRTEWSKVVCFGKLAEIVGEYLSKGSQIYLEGRLRTESWEDKEGIKRYATKIYASNLVMLGKGKEKEPSKEDESQDDRDVPF